MMPPYKLTNDGAAAVAPEVKWKPIDAATPLGSKMLLISKPNGIATVSVRRSQDGWTHWFPLPTFELEGSPASLPAPDSSQYKLALASTQAEAAELRKQLEIATAKLNVSKLIKESTE